MLSFSAIVSSRPHQCAVIAEQAEPVGAVLLCCRVAALLLVYGVSFRLRQAEKTADHAEVLPQCSVLGAGVLLPAQQLTQPALRHNQKHTHTRIKISYIDSNSCFMCIEENVGAVVEHSDARIYVYELM